jgi:hypothetical protein
MNKRFSFRPAHAAAVAAFASVATFTGAAHATLPLGLSTAIEAYQTDATTALGLIMGAGVVVWGLIKLKSKLGW